MENLLFLFATSIVLRISSNRSAKNHLIADTGCSVFLFSRNMNFETVKTKKGDKLYYKEFYEEGVQYGIICIKLKEFYLLDEAEELLRTYMFKLKKSLCIQQTTGIHRCTNWNDQSSVSVMDYWRDADGEDWKVKGYTNGQVMSVLYIKNISHSDVRKEDLFLDSFYFPIAQ